MKNKVMFTILIGFLLLTTGCGSSKYIVDKDGKQILTESTKQTLRNDIFCKPSEGTEAYKIYEENEDQMKFKLSKLPECSEFTLTSTKNTSLWETVFVKPVAFLILKLGNVFKDWGMTKAYLGLSLIVIGLLIRIIILPFNIKTQKQSQRLQKAMPKLQRIEKKYAGRTDQESAMLKAQETMAVYNEMKVNPLSSCLISLIQLPVFFAFLSAIYKIPTLYEGEIFSWNLGMTPQGGVAAGNYTYLILVALIILTTYFSFKYTMKQSAAASTTVDAGSQMNFMLYFMTIFIGFSSFFLPTAIALYWIATYAFIIVQTYVTNLILNKGNKEKHSNKELKKETKKIKDKIKEKEGMKYGKNE